MKTYLHDDKNYCVITDGFYPFLETELKKMLGEL